MSLLNGYVNLLKPPGMSSAAAVAFVKRLTGEKCGHAGTLDPEVAGVLPVMVGRATRLQQFFTDKTKAYIGEICFSGATDTQDAQGALVQLGRGVPDRTVLEAMIRERFLGQIMQVPPMYSAVKQGGRPLYAVARAGGTAAVAARPAVIHRCEVLSRADKFTYRLRVECGSGTYIRTLFHDLGQALDCPAHMRMLIRTRSGCFTLRDSLTCEALAEAREAGRLADCLLPMEWPLTGYPRVELDRRTRALARNGVPFAADSLGLEAGQAAAVYVDGVFFGVGATKPDGFRMAFLADPSFFPLDVKI